MTPAATLSAEALIASLRAIADHSFDSIMRGKRSQLVGSVCRPGMQSLPAERDRAEAVTVIQRCVSNVLNPLVRYSLGA